MHHLIEAYKKISTEKKLVISGGSSHSQTYFDSVRKLAKDDERIILRGLSKAKL